MATSLTQFQSDDRTFQMMQNSWAAQINPLLANPMASGLFLKGIVLTTGANVINHLLGVFSRAGSSQTAMAQPRSIEVLHSTTKL